jgi:tetratricopeptide (TPR) repeat protein
LRYGEGRYDEAIEHAQAAIRRLTERNPNPPTGLAHYRLGLAAARIGNRSLAHDAFCKAAWNGELSSAALLAAAQIDAAEARYDAALERIDGSLSSNAQNLQAQDLRALVLTRLGQRSEVQRHGSSILKGDALDWWARDIVGQQLDCDSKTCLDIAASYAVAGFLSEALRVLGRADEIAAGELYSGTRPLIAYRRAALFDAMGDVERARQAVGVAESLPVAYCFPWLLDDYDALVVARSLAPNDLNAGYLLGTWLYAHGRRYDALAVWQSVAASGSKEPLLWRNIGLAVVNTDGDLGLALDHYDHALELAPSDHRLLFERDQLVQRCGYSPAQRLSTLQAFPESVSARDDLTIELADLLTDTGSATQALEILQSRRFQPWEGGEGKVLATWERTLVSLSRRELLAGSPATAHRLIQLAFEPPTNLGEARHPLASMARLWLCLGDIYAAEHRTVEATEAWRHAAEHHGDFREMAVDGYGETTAYSVVAYERLGETADAGRLVEQLESYTEAFAQQPAGVDYFATSLPRQRLFGEDLAAVRDQRAHVLRAEIEWCRGNHESARSRLDAVLRRDASARVVRDLLDWFDFEENRATRQA